MKLKAERRYETGKGIARKLRDSGKIPGVLYGSGIEPCSLAVKLEDLNEVIRKHGGTNVLVELELANGGEGGNHLAIIKEIQRHPFKERILHVDFMRVERFEKVTARVPIMISGEEKSRGLKAGGTLQHILWEVEVECLPEDIPDHAVANVEKIAVGEHLSVGELIVPPGVKVLSDPGDVVLTILAPRVAVAAAPEEEIEEAPPSEISKEGAQSKGEKES